MTVRGLTAVPFFSPPDSSALLDSLVQDIADLAYSGKFVNGPAVAEFEGAFAEYCGVTHCVGVSSGLDGLRIALLAAGLERGAQVIVPAHTFVATVEAVVQAGGEPILVDIAESDYGLDVDRFERAITASTRFVLPVHLYGQLVDVARLAEVAGRHDVAIVEDACQAHGAVRDGRLAGTIGLAAAFSFYPAKNLGAFGDAGAIVTSSFELADNARALREHGQHRKYEHDREGYTARLDTIQALVLLRKLEFLDEWNAERRRLAARYTEALADVGDLRLPPVPSGSEPVWHLYVVRTAQPESLAAFLGDRGIGSGRHYPQPVHLTRAYAHLGHVEGGFPVAEALARECLSLPIFPGMTDEQLGAVVDAVRAFFHG